MSIINRSVYSTKVMKPMDNVDKNNQSQSTQSTVLSKESSVEKNRFQRDVFGKPISNFINLRLGHKTKKFIKN